jgi:hypothetical protein
MQAELLGKSHRVPRGGEGVAEAAQRDPVGALTGPQCR